MNLKVGLVYKLEIVGTPYFLYGSTINLTNRIKSYKSYLKRNKYTNLLLQNVHNKYGWETIKFTIVQDGIPEKILGCVEDIWIGANCARIEDNKGGMNMRDGQRTNFSQETKDKISKSLTGRKLSEENRQKMLGRKVSDETKLKIGNSHRGKKHSEEAKRKMSQKAIGNKNSISYIEKIKRKVYQIDIRTNEVINSYNSIIEASRVTNINAGNIGRTCKTKQGTAGGYRWKYIE